MKATGQTTNDVAKTILDSLSPAPGKTWFVEALAVGRSTGTDFGAIKREFVADNVGGTISIAGAGANRINYGATGATNGWDLTVTGGSSLNFSVKGGSGQTVDWKVSISYKEV